MRKERKNWTGSEKMAILRKHLIEGVPISAVCEMHGQQPTVFYGCQKRLFEGGAAVFESGRGEATTAAVSLPGDRRVTASLSGDRRMGDFNLRVCAHFRRGYFASTDRRGRDSCAISLSMMRRRWTAAL